MLSLYNTPLTAETARFVRLVVAVGESVTHKTAGDTARVAASTHMLVLRATCKVRTLPVIKVPTSTTKNSMRGTIYK